ncbi:MAG: M50 family metallopeptidase, partial [Candidatus Ratteibacteria bacterium]|nr:M50 family metallopeptidase [Candidatus Ratteibacteria bacterium]
MDIFISYFIKTLYVIFVFGILIFFHELGHFIVAKRMKVKVEKFSFGWGPVLIKFKRGETEYVVSLVPVGGYVKMAGENLSERKGKEGEFYSKRPHQRIAIVAAGPIMSFALAFVIFYIVVMAGVATVDPNAKVGGLIEGYPAQSVGIKEGDLIVAINEQPINSWQQMAQLIRENPGKEILITLERDGEIISFYVATKEEVLNGGQKIGQIGIYPDVIIEKANPLAAIYKSAEGVGKTTYLIIHGLSELIRVKVSAKEALGGPILIARITAELSEAGFMPVLNFAGMISVMLGLINLFP